MQYLLIFVNIWSILVTPTHVCYVVQSRRHFFCFLHALLKKYMFWFVFDIFGQELVNIGQYLSMYVPTYYTGVSTGVLKQYQSLCAIGNR